MEIVIEGTIDKKEDSGAWKWVTIEIDEVVKAFWHKCDLKGSLRLEWLHPSMRNPVACRNQLLS